MSKINSAESIRGLACMAVVLSHLSLAFAPFLHNFERVQSSGNSIIDWIHHSPLGFFYSGSGAVFIFFVLSGYVLSYAILSKKDIPLKIKSMALKRYPRLAIPAGISCLVAFAILSIPVDTSNILGNWMQKYGTSNATIFDALYEGFIGSFLFGYINTNWVLWTMQIELIGSFVLFALLYIYNFNNKLFIPIALISPLPFAIISPVVALGVYAFVFGIFIYLYGKKIPTILSILFLIIGLYFAGVHNTSDSYSLFTSVLGTKTSVLLNFAAGLFVVYSILMNEKLSQFLDKKVLVWLGTLSFSIYLLHIPLIYLVAVPSFNFILELSNSYATSAILSSIILIAITLFFSHFYSKYVDQLSIKVANRIEKATSKPAQTKKALP
nr:acyltransferase [Acinetobacter lwoffii]